MLLITEESKVRCHIPAISHETQIPRAIAWELMPLAPPVPEHIDIIHDVRLEIP